MTEALDSLHPSLRDLVGTTIVGRYQVEEALGVGGMGAVFRGHHLGLKRDVAIKVLHPDLTRDPEISKRFDREAHSASRLDHPNCLRVTDVGSTDDGVKFMIMDLLEGEELGDRMGEPISPERAVLMTLQILRGLEHAHEHGVVHRDVKPENIFVTRDHDGREILKLVDFGIAKLVGGSTHDTRMTKAGLVFGTPAYMSPEQAMGMEADGRADLYAVGVILYEMLLGVPPFESDDPVKLVRMQVSKDPPSMPETIVAPALAAVVMKLLDKDRDDRYQTATEAREALEQVLPSIASSDIISGVTILGSTTSGPIVIGHSTSVPVIVPVAASGPRPAATGPQPATGAFSPASLPTLPPGGGAMKPPRSKLPIIGGSALAVLGLAAWLTQGSDEPDPSDPDATELAASAEDGGEDGDAVLTVDDAPDPERLSEVDRLILANKLTEAQQLLQPMLDEYPDNAILAWRQGRIHAKKKKRKDKPKALAAYSDAVDAQPSLLQNNEFYAELHSLMLDPKLRSEALDFAVRKMGRSGHKFLLELINDDRDPMGYDDRRRALQELATVEQNEPLVNLRLHLALDLLQATEALTPCSAYRHALDNIARSPDHWFLPRVENAKIPRAKTGDGLTDEERADGLECEGLEARRAEVIAQLEALAPVEETGGDELVIDDESPDDGSGSASSSANKKSGGGNRRGSSGCNSPFGFLKKKCR